jgi:hypothetical protein
MCGRSAGCQGRGMLPGVPARGGINLLFPDGRNAGALDVNGFTHLAAANCRNSGVGASLVAATANNVVGFSLARAKGAAVFGVRSRAAHTARVCAFLCVFHGHFSSLELDSLILPVIDADRWPIIFKHS